MTEQQFVEKLVDLINSWSSDLNGAKACWGKRFDYASYRFSYSQDGVVSDHQNRGYQTDLMIYDQFGDDWIPRIIVECKFGSVTTHDFLTYGKKAEAHRSLHPYLRYGFVVGGLGGTLPFRALVHGSAFDFLAILPIDEAGDKDAKLKRVLKSEVTASRVLWDAFRSKKMPADSFLLHRGLNILNG